MAKLSRVFRCVKICCFKSMIAGRRCVRQKEFFSLHILDTLAFNTQEKMNRKKNILKIAIPRRSVFDMMQ